jgi:hypothetical protein
VVVTHWFQCMRLPAEENNTNLRLISTDPNYSPTTTYHTRFFRFKSFFTFLFAHTTSYRTIPYIIFLWMILNLKLSWPLGCNRDGVWCLVLTWRQRLSRKIPQRRHHYLGDWYISSLG